jgi:hypothetical protein
MESRGTLLRVSLSHKDLADLVGASRPRVTEQLAELERERLLIRQGRQLIVCLDKIANSASVMAAASASFAKADAQPHLLKQLYSPRLSATAASAKPLTREPSFSPVARPVNNSSAMAWANVSVRNRTWLPINENNWLRRCLMLLLIILLILLFGGGGGYYGYRSGYYRPRGMSLVTIVLIVLVVWLVMGGGLIRWALLDRGEENAEVDFIWLISLASAHVTISVQEIIFSRDHGAKHAAL